MKIPITILISGLLALHAATAASALNVQWRSDFLYNTGGGLSEGSTHIGQMDAAFEFTSVGLFNEEATWLVSAFYNTGDAFTARAGDIQVVSNIEADDSGVRLNEAWVDQPLPWGDSSLLVGKYDLNGEFDVLESALPFVNSAFGVGTDIGQTGVNGPSIFPATGFALRLKAEFGDWSGKFAVLDGVPGDPSEPGRTQINISSSEGALVVAEAAFENDGRKLIGGYWRYTSGPEPICDVTVCGRPNASNSGIYLRGEAPLLATSSGSQVDGFFRVGTAASEFNPLERFYSLGILVSAPNALRPDDAVGLAFAYGGTGSDYDRALRADGLGAASHEGVIELTYIVAVHSNLRLQPTIQFIDNPGATESVDDTWSMGVRLDLTFP